MKLTEAETLLVQLLRRGLPSAHQEPIAEISPALWHSVLDAAEFHWLSPLLYTTILAAPPSSMPDEVLAKLRSTHARWSIANWFAFRELGELLDIFESEQIPVVVLKGCALAPTLYQDISLRPISDLDLLIPEHALEHASAMVKQRGYIEEYEVATGFQQRFMKEKHFVAIDLVPGLVDIHWHVFNGSFYYTHAPIEWFWQHTIPVSFDGRTVRTFSVEAQLIHSSAHFVLQHDSEGLLWLYEIALLVSTYRHQLDWAQLIQVAAEFKLVRPLRAALRDACQVWKISIPADAQNALNALPVGVQENAIFTMTVSKDPRLRLLAKGWFLPGWSEKFQFWFHKAFPSERFMQERYNLGSHRLTPFDYVRRFLSR